MNPTSADVMPLLDPVASSLYDGVEYGAAIADDLLSYQHDPWYWSHSARFAARNWIRQDLDEIDGYALVPGVPNSGIHLRIGDTHDVRLLRSAHGTVPAPGRNRRRRRSYVNHPTLWPIGEIDTAGLDGLSLIVDWQMSNGEPMLHLSLPAGPWDYGSAVRLHWRTPLPRGKSASWTDLRFDSDDGGDPLVIDPFEREAIE